MALALLSVIFVFYNTVMMGSTFSSYIISITYTQGSHLSTLYTLIFTLTFSIFHLCICEYVCVLVYECMCVYIWEYMCMCVYVYKCVFMCMSIWCVHVRVCVHVCACMCMPVHACAPWYMCIFVFVQATCARVSEPPSVSLTVSQSNPELTKVANLTGQLLCRSHVFALWSWNYT